MAHWFVVRDGKEHGPLSPQKLKELVSAGRLTPTDLVRREDMPAPRPAGQVKGLFPAGTPSPPQPALIKAPDLPATPPPIGRAESGKKLKAVFSIVGPICGVLVLVGGGIRGCIQATGNRSQPAAVAAGPTAIEPAADIQAPAEPVVAVEQEVVSEISLADGRPQIETFLGYMKERERFRLQTPEGGIDIEGTPFQSVFEPIGKPVRLHVGESDYLGEKVFVWMAEIEEDGRLAALVLGTPMDLSRERRRGNDVGSLAILMGSIVPGYELRKLLREKGAQVASSSVSETFGKANVLTRYDRESNEMRAIITIDP